LSNLRTAKRVNISLEKTRDDQKDPRKKEGKPDGNPSNTIRKSRRGRGKMLNLGWREGRKKATSGVWGNTNFVKVEEKTASKARRERKGGRNRFNCRGVKGPRGRGCTEPL